MKRKIQLMAAAAFMALLILPSLAWGVLCMIGEKDPMLMESLDPDLGENRNKASFPESFDPDEFTGQLESYYNDRAPFRNFLVRWNQIFSGKLESIYQKSLEPGLIAWMYGKGTSEKPDMPTLPPVNTGEHLSDTDLNPKKDLTGQSSESAGDSQNESSSEEEIHDYVVAEQYDPTCEKEGSITYRCVDCGDVYTEILPATGHEAEARVVEPSYLNYGYTEYTCSVCGRTWRSDFVEKPLDDSYLPPRLAGDYTILGRYNWLFYRGNATLSYYRGDNILTQQEMEEYLAVLQQLKDACDSRGIRLCFMILPNKEEVYSEYMPTYKITEAVGRDERLAEYIRENSDIDFIYPLQELKEGKVRYDTYYQYDSHWNNAGGFIGAQALYGALGMPVTDFLDWSVKEVPGAPTGLIATGGLDPANYPEDHDYVIDYRPDVEVTDVEGEKSILCATGIYRARSDCGNNQKLVLLGDSFRAAMLPYLERDFAEICAAHRDETGKVKQDIMEADVLVVTAVERFDKLLFETAQVLTGYLSQ